MITELQKNKLEQFNVDVEMREAVFKVLYSVVDINDFVEHIDSYSNSQLGQIVRGNTAGAKLLKLGMKEILKFKRENAGTPQIPAGL